MKDEIILSIKAVHQVMQEAFFFFSKLNRKLDKSRLPIISAKRKTNQS